MVIILMVIVGYYIKNYCWLLYQWLLVVICGYILLMVIDAYSINDCQQLLYWWLLVVILLMAIDGYFINGY